MKIILTLDFPEATTSEEVRQLAKGFIQAGREYAITQVNVVDFEIEKEEDK